MVQRLDSCSFDPSITLRAGFAQDGFRSNDSNPVSATSFRNAEVANDLLTGVGCDQIFWETNCVVSC
jgi:hypothetical protein